MSHVAAPLSFSLLPSCGPVAAQRRVAGVSHEPQLANAAEAPRQVEAAAAIQAGPAGAVVQVDGAEASGEAAGTDAGEPVDAVQADGVVGARLHPTVVYVCLTARSGETRQTAAGKLRSKTVGVLTETAVFTGRPGENRRNYFISIM